MLVIVILANGLLQNVVQPIAFGATLDLNPLVVLIVTIGFGSIFGMVGLVLGGAAHLGRAAHQPRPGRGEGRRAAARARSTPPDRRRSPSTPSAGSGAAAQLRQPG